MPGPLLLVCAHPDDGSSSVTGTTAKYTQRGVSISLIYATHGDLYGGRSKKLSIGLMDEHTVLKNWYKELGFKGIGAQVFHHLPFTVCFMERSF